MQKTDALGNGPMVVDRMAQALPMREFPFSPQSIETSCAAQKLGYIPIITAFAVRRTKLTDRR